jgi:hypothetical protein
MTRVAEQVDLMPYLGWETMGSLLSDAWAKMRLKQLQDCQPIFSLIQETKTPSKVGFEELIKFDVSCSSTKE